MNLLVPCTDVNLWTFDNAAAAVDIYNAAAETYKLNSNLFLEDPDAFQLSTWVHHKSFCCGFYIKPFKNPEMTVVRFPSCVKQIV